MKSFSFLMTVVLCLELLSHSVYSQDVKSDTSFLASAVSNAKTYYIQRIGGESPLFNGVQYKELNIHNYDEGHPYFLSDDWIDGSINYDGGLYENIPMQYDLINDKIIIDHPISHFKLELISEKVNSFLLDGHRVVKLYADSTKTSIKSGFYESLYDGKIKAYVKHKKEKREVFESNVIKSFFDVKDQYYIWMNDIYYPVKSKSSILKIFNNKKTLLRKYLNKNKINFKNNRGLAIAKSAEFYEQSEKQP
jgi:hypothetical protein